SRRAASWLDHSPPSSHENTFQHEQTEPDEQRGIREIEDRPVVLADLPADEIRHTTGADTVDQITERAATDQRECGEPHALLGARAHGHHADRDQRHRRDECEHDLPAFHACEAGERRAGVLRQLPVPVAVDEWLRHACRQGLRPVLARLVEARRAEEDRHKQQGPPQLHANKTAAMCPAIPYPRRWDAAAAGLLAYVLYEPGFLRLGLPTFTGGLLAFVLFLDV